jgi:hypothetical protein
MKKHLFPILALFGLAVPSLAHAEWTSLISSTFFDGIQTDLVTAAGGILGLALVILGLVMLVRAIGR